MIVRSYEVKSKYSEQVCTAARLDREQANELVLRLLEKYESQIDAPPSGSTYQDCYDAASGKPGETYLELYNEAKEELATMGVPFK